MRPPQDWGPVMAANSVRVLAGYACGAIIVETLKWALRDLPWRIKRAALRREIANLETDVLA